MTLSVSVRLAGVILATARVHGADAGAVAAGAGLDVALLAEPDARITLALEEALWREAARATGIEHIGLAAAELVTPGTFDVLDYAVRSSANAGEALDRLIRLNRLEHDAATFSVEPRRSGRVRVVHAFRADTGAPGRQLTEFTLAALLVASRQCTGESIVPLEVHFRSARPVDTEPYARVFGAPVHFDQPDSALVVEASVLSLPFRRADSALCAILERHAEALLAALPRLDASVAERVRRLVTDELRGGTPSIRVIAARLAMSERSLQRKLAAEDAAFDTIVDELRAELALRYLGDPRLSVSGV
ncbi:MAG TPA: AraC family transcriptional regulator ligand-binding domain-containing protein, partial [Labilithrix sp.]|nr:AraC family transcriptional regulator ligand-binding domain-containing protein [Labilithrix sp.]